jgi:hypothetical protein
VLVLVVEELLVVVEEVLGPELPPIGTSGGEAGGDVEP